jgi:3-polyprenyl-4-hydroxybenzoate decarboxylase
MTTDSLRSFVTALEDVGELIRVQRVLDHMGVEASLVPRWKGEA